MARGTDMFSGVFREGSSGGTAGRPAKVEDGFDGSRDGCVVFVVADIEDAVVKALRVNSLIRVKIVVSSWYKAAAVMQMKMDGSSFMGQRTALYTVWKRKNQKDCTCCRKYKSCLNSGIS